MDEEQVRDARSDALPAMPLPKHSCLRACQCRFGARGCFITLLLSRGNRCSDANELQRRPLDEQMSWTRRPAALTMPA
eukprot:3219589-Pleurochrysis_carterae.AAC.11